VKKAKRSKH